MSNLSIQDELWASYNKSLENQPPHDIDEKILERGEDAEKWLSTHKWTLPVPDERRYDWVAPMVHEALGVEVIKKHTDILYASAQFNTGCINLSSVDRYSQEHYKTAFNGEIKTDLANHIMLDDFRFSGKKSQAKNMFVKDYKAYQVKDFIQESTEQLLKNPYRYEVRVYHNMWCSEHPDVKCEYKGHVVDLYDFDAVAVYIRPYHCVEEVKKLIDKRYKPLKKVIDYIEWEYCRFYIMRKGLGVNFVCVKHNKIRPDLWLKPYYAMRHTKIVILFDQYGDVEKHNYEVMTIDQYRDYAKGLDRYTDIMNQYYEEATLDIRYRYDKYLDFYEKFDLPSDFNKMLYKPVDDETHLSNIDSLFRDYEGAKDPDNLESFKAISEGTGNDGEMIYYRKIPGTLNIYNRRSMSHPDVTIKDIKYTEELTSEQNRVDSKHPFIDYDEFTKRTYRKALPECRCCSNNKLRRVNGAWICGRGNIYFIGYEKLHTYYKDVHYDLIASKAWQYRADPVFEYIECPGCGKELRHYFGASEPNYDYTFESGAELFHCIHCKSTTFVHEDFDLEEDRIDYTTDAAWIGSKNGKSDTVRTFVRGGNSEEAY